jgi:hypothetical protein
MYHEIAVGLARSERTAMPGIPLFADRRQTD